ncbi:MAG TPA: AraC family transcriptional regulator [Devosiaceae bacterium]|jgi:AraC-like DNA-binding protein
MGPPPPLLRFSSDQLDERDRVEAWREKYAESVLHIELEPKRDTIFRSDLTIRSLADLDVFTDFSSPSLFRRTRDFSDDFVFVLHLSGHGTINQRNRSELLRPGEATLASGAEASWVSTHENMHCVVMLMPAAMLAPMVVDPYDAVARRIPANLEALRLLTGYVQAVQKSESVFPAQMRQVVSNQIYDLAAMTLGASRDAQEQAQRRGIRAARLRALKDDIAVNLAAGISVDALAARHRISPRYIRSLFASEETSLTDFILARRLELAYRLLSLAGERSISSIAFAAGFADLTHFNHAFRRRYHMTPSDVRAGLRATGGGTP